MMPKPKKFITVEEWLVEKKLIKLSPADAGYANTLKVKMHWFQCSFSKHLDSNPTRGFDQVDKTEMECVYALYIAEQKQRKAQKKKSGSTTSTRSKKALGTKDTKAAFKNAMELSDQELLAEDHRKDPKIDPYAIPSCNWNPGPGGIDPGDINTGGGINPGGIDPGWIEFDFDDYFSDPE